MNLYNLPGIVRIGIAIIVFIANFILWMILPPQLYDRWEIMVDLIEG